MPICEYCKKNVHATLRITLPLKLRIKSKKRNWKKRVKARFCFNCIREYARDCLDPKGYWFQFVFPHRMPVHRRYK